MLQAWRRAAAFPTDEPARQRMWLYTIAAHVLANHRRSIRRHRNLAERLRAQLVTSPDKSADPADHADLIVVRDAVKRLKKEHRELIMLVHWDGLTLVEAAELLLINPSTARSRYAAAKETLRGTLSVVPSSPDDLSGTFGRP
jgi:RNA polymerase sigma-70 factor, ECF subfamily